MPQKKWYIAKADEGAVGQLAEQLQLPHSIARLLILRGINSPVAAQAFLHPRLDSLSDPSALPDIRPAVDRIWAAVHASESISIFGDYDVDGVTSTALMVRVLSELGASVSAFVPDRLDEGYGLSPDALERCLAEQQPGLLISVDCGTNSVDSIAQAQALGVDVIVTDHHEPAEETAPALALINPKLGSGGENLSGVGVAFKLAHALIKHGRDQGFASAKQVDLRRYFDIVALGTVADLVPLTGENRTMVRHGLVQMHSTCWIGLESLKDVAAIRGELNTGHLGFQLGPRINAAGRIGEPMQAVRLLTTSDPLEARNIANLLNRNNQERREIERKITDQAMAEIDSYFDPGKHFGLVVSGDRWHPGVVGIVASRVSHRYNRPAIVMGVDEEGTARGSCRSIEAFDILAGLQTCRQHLSKFGGHKMAAGLEVKPGELEAFKTAFNEAAMQQLQPVDLTPVQQVDAVVDPRDLDWAFFEKMRHLRPFGQENPEPVWALKNACVLGAPRVVGQKHLKLNLAAEGQSFDAIAFNYPLDALPAGALDVAFTLKENNWNGGSSLQLQVKDIRPCCE